MNNYFSGFRFGSTFLSLFTIFARRIDRPLLKLPKSHVPHLAQPECSSVENKDKHYQFLYLKKGPFIPHQLNI